MKAIPFWEYNDSPEKRFIPLYWTFAMCHCPTFQRIASINGLQELYLDNNGLNRLPKNLGDISQLRLLSLGRNQLSTLPDGMRKRWDTFEILYLGDNQFTENPIDEEWMTMFKQGSIGSNPIPEPISPLWMTKQDAREFFQNDWRCYC